MTTDLNLACQIEEEAIAKLYRYLGAFGKFEKPLLAVMRRKYTPEEILEAEGKRCIISIRGLKYHELVLFFEISNLSIKQVEPYEGYDTSIEAPIRIVNLFLARILAGDEDAFGDLLTGNEVKIRGKHTFHDVAIFEQVCGELARNIKQMKAAMKL